MVDFINELFVIYRMVKKQTNWKPFGKGPAGRPKNR
jgi:hypothetical protein